MPIYVALPVVLVAAYIAVLGVLECYAFFAIVILGGYQ